MDSATDTFTVERELTIAAPPAAVWKLLVDPAEQSRWWGTPLDFDPRPGGPFRVEVVPGHIARGEFVELDEPTRLVYTWGWEGQELVPPGSSTISIDLAAIDLAADGEGSSTAWRRSRRGPAGVSDPRGLSSLRLSALRASVRPR